MNSTETIGALSGVRVLDLTHVLAGPFAAYQLALLGADVVKIEAPDRPDCARGRGPDDALNAAGLGLTYQVQGANKRALALDLTQPRGRDLFEQLVAGADVVVENHTPGALGRRGVDLDALRARHPRLIVCRISGYGGEFARGAYDNTIQAASGSVAQSGGRKPGVSFVDYAAGYAAAFAIAAALVQRARTGRGVDLDVSMLEAALATMAPEAAAALFDGGPAPRPKEAGIVAYETSDGVLMLGAFTPEQHRRLGRALEAAGVAAPDGLAECVDWPAVWSRAAALKTELQAIFATRPAEAWIEALFAFGLPAERVATIAEAVRRPELEARGAFQGSPAGDGASLPIGAARYSEGGPEIRRAPPRHGADTEAILSELGLDASDLAALRAEGVIR